MAVTFFLNANIATVTATIHIIPNVIIVYMISSLVYYYPDIIVLVHILNYIIDIITTIWAAKYRYIWNPELSKTAADTGVARVKAIVANTIIATVKVRTFIEYTSLIIDSALSN